MSLSILNRINNTRQKFEWIFNYFTNQIANASNNSPDTSSLGWLNVKKAFGAKENGIYLYDVATTASSNIVTSARGTFSSSDIGKVIKICMAGTGGADHTATITQVDSSTQIRISVNAVLTTSGKFAVYGTDDTAAIQAAINSLSTIPWATLYFPIENKGIYVINGALNRDADKSYPNSQLYMPVYGDLNDNLTLEVLPSIVFQGQVTPGPNISYSAAGSTRPIGQVGVILHSTLTAGTAYTDNGTNVNGQTFSDIIPPAVIGGRNRALGYYTKHTRMSLKLSDVSITVASNNGLAGGAVLSGINGKQIDCLGVSGVRVITDVAGKDAIEPTNENYGVIFPDYSTDNQRDNNELFVSGFKYGIVYGEHGTYSNMWTLSCKYGHVFTKSLHPMLVIKASSQYCTYPVAVASSTLLSSRAGQISFDIQNLQLEQYVEGTSSSWRKTVATIIDTDSWASARIRGQAYNISLSPAVIVPMTKSGGTGIRISNMSMYKYANNTAAKAAGLPSGTDYENLTGDYKVVYDEAVTVYEQNFTGANGTGAQTLTPQTGSGNLDNSSTDLDWLCNGSGAALCQATGNNRLNVSGLPLDNIRITADLASTLSTDTNSFSINVGRNSVDSANLQQIALTIQRTSSNYQIVLTKTVSGSPEWSSVVSSNITPFANPTIVFTMQGLQLTGYLYNGATLLATISKTMLATNPYGIHGFTANHVGCAISNFKVETI